MNILILGLGSIGQRHLRNLHSINKNFNFFVLRKKFITPSLNNKNLVVKQDIKKKYKLKYLKNLGQIKSLSLRIDAAFICTPSKCLYVLQRSCAKSVGLWRFFYRSTYLDYCKRILSYWCQWCRISII